LTTLAAVIGRIATGFVVDKFDRRVVTSVNFAVQALGIAVLAMSAGQSPLWLGCVLFGAGVGNTTSLPGLIVHQEFPKQHFARIVSIVVAINQFTFAFGPTLVAQLQHAEGTYTQALLMCLALELAAAIIVLLPVAIRRRAARRSRPGASYSRFPSFAGTGWDRGHCSSSASCEKDEPVG
jgi:MFS family permease